jgi:hypothetical protein
MKTKAQILKDAIRGRGILTRDQVNKIARRNGHSEQSLWDFYLEHYYDLVDGEAIESEPAKDEPISKEKEDYQQLLREQEADREKWDRLKQLNNANQQLNNELSGFFL